MAGSSPPLPMSLCSRQLAGPVRKRRAWCKEPVWRVSQRPEDSHVAVRECEMTGSLSLGVEPPTVRERVGAEINTNSPAFRQCSRLCLYLQKASIRFSSRAGYLSLAACLSPCVGFEMSRVFMRVGRAVPVPSSGTPLWCAFLQVGADWHGVPAATNSRRAQRELPSPVPTMQLEPVPPPPQLRE